ncbi:MAG: glycosyltransferase [Lysobacteraceae bacterium]
MSASAPICLLYPCSADALARLRPRLPDGMMLFESAHDDLATALAEAAAAHPDHDLLAVRADADLPTHAWPRLALARAARPDVECWTPLCALTAELDPRPAGSAMPADAVDRWAHLLAERSYPQSAQRSPLLGLWSAAALARQPWRNDFVDIRTHLCDLLFVDADAVRTTPAVDQSVRHPAVGALALRLEALSDVAPPAYVGLDGRPTLLHVLHGWGGGAQRFVEDLIDADSTHRHLVLIARGDPAQRLHGQMITLHEHPARPPLREWPLAAPTATSHLASAEHHALLHQVIADFGVAGVLVSSLIGHALDVLRSGLPTAVVCHDYYPLWPRLHADFGAVDADFSATAIPTALAAEDADFADSRPPHWQALRAGYLAALAEADALLIAPSQCVRDNLVRIAPQLAERRWAKIGHGLAPWPQPLPEIRPDPHRANLRIVVPGRLRAGKGEALLAELLPILPADVELALLGCGAAGMRFFGHPQVHVRLDYRRDELPALLAALRPDAALLPATVAETFSYTLSELRSLGVPVIATALGSFVERIRHGENGLLVAPDAHALAQLLARLAEDSGPLLPLQIRQAERDPAAMADDYAAALALAARAPRSYGRDPLPVLRMQQARRDAIDLRVRVDALSARLDSQRAELERRADWAQRAQHEADERQTWIGSLKREIDDARAQHRQAMTQLTQTESELQRRTAWASGLDAEVNLLRHSLAETGEALSQAEAEHARHAAEQEQALADARRQHEAEHEVAEELRRYVDSLTRQRDTFERERNEIIASHSWRLTRPLRGVRRLLGQAGSRLRFRLARLLSGYRRAANHLRQRGLRATMRRMRQEYAAPPPVDALDIPSVPDEGQQHDLAELQLALPDTPRASVVIPVYNHLHHTLTCLRSLAAHPQRHAFEVIVVDDCSQDESADLLPRVPGLRYLRNAENLGFIGACNAGAAAASGEYLVFLNNDTAVQDDWLDALLDTFQAHPEAGLVGAKLVYPDGRLQEAGGIVFRDGGGWNYGRFGDPADPRYNYLREADYCSGAAIALPAALFRQLGGFDSHYAPAYYEDTDLAMKVRAAGRKVYYQPASVVAHFEGVSSGTDTASGVKAYQVVNKEKFLDRWRETLAAHASAPPDTPIEIAREHRARRRVLVIDATTPQPDQDSGSVRMVNLLRLLREEGCAVTFFADNRAFVPGYSDALQQLGIEVLWHPFLSDPVGWFAERGAQFDAVILSRHYIASQYLDLVRRYAPRARLIFDTVDLHYLREQRAAELAGRDDLARSAAQTREQELEVIAGSDITLVVSPVEQRLLADDAPAARVEVLSNVHEVFGCRRPFAERADLMFIGGFQHPPNIDAAQWFVGEVWPLIHAARPELRFHLIGSKATDEVRALGEVEGVSFHGFVEDIEPFLDGCRMSVAPLRYGAGVKGKVNMGMSYGQPVVATSVAVEGMHLRDGEDVLVADDADAFAAAVLRLYDDQTLWQTLSDNGADNVRRHFGFDAARGVLRRLLDL